MDNDDIPPEIDTSKAHSARMYDYFLGKVAKVFPQLRSEVL